MEAEDPVDLTQEEHFDDMDVVGGLKACPIEATPLPLPGAGVASPPSALPRVRLPPQPPQQQPRQMPPQPQQLPPQQLSQQLSQQLPQQHNPWLQPSHFEFPLHQMNSLDGAPQAMGGYPTFPSSAFPQSAPSNPAPRPQPKYLGYKGRPLKYEGSMVSLGIDKNGEEMFEGFCTAKAKDAFGKDTITCKLSLSLIHI